MASAILTSRNGQRSGDFMTKFTNNSDLNFMRLQNVPNSNRFFSGNTSRDVFCTRQPQPQLPYPAPQQAAFIAPSIPPNSYGYRYVTFRLSSYSKRELRELKKRFMSDLDRVRILRQRVCNTSKSKTNYLLELPAAPGKGRNPTPKTNYHPPLLELPAAGRNRANPAKKQCGRTTNAQKRKMMMRECGQILGKLMKHKHGWVFNTPVDAAALKLYDYHNIITNPMDLGTIKSKLTKNEYESPLAFASDVRLTFNNAMVYNGKDSNVYIMAERLLLMFEDLFDSTSRKFVVKKQNCTATAPRVSNSAIVANGASLGVRVSKRPEMTAEQKSELAASFWNLKLGPEGLDQIMAIVKKGVLGLEHQGDEIELDLAVLDNDTLWGLHSFVSRAREEAVVTNLIPSAQTNNQLEEEDVDIGEEMQPTGLPSIEIDKDTVNVSSSESSSGDSSSSDSGSGTCSGNSYNEHEVNSTTKVVA